MTVIILISQVGPSLQCPIEIPAFIKHCNSFFKNKDYCYGPAIVRYRADLCNAKSIF